MSAIQIVMYVCLLANPSACEEKAIPANDAGTVSQCMFWAQPHIAQWSVTHPKYKIVRWKCSVQGADGEPI
ncbi:hypothetical protein [Chthonobacter rhizosphaerae]|uniref:hypothetical protein n=1 Tax=Chthonobacter rhizosphaerae TaxID=2735553 RepID=UPI0015EF824C|nr:hypothetical protein [Chthonobacter rhizosphaerae]